MWLERPMPLPPDTRADIHRILAVISRSSWLSIALVGVVLAVFVWFLMRLRRSLARNTSMHFLLNSAVVITALLFAILGLAAVNMLVEPAVELQAFFGVWCVPPPRVTTLILLGACLASAIVEALVARSTAG